MAIVAILGSKSNHGGVVVSASSDLFVHGIGVARVGDMHSCPLPGHGITPIVSGSSDSNDTSRKIARVGDRTGCGATITTGNDSLLVGG